MFVYVCVCVCVLQRLCSENTDPYLFVKNISISNYSSSYI